MFSFNIIKRLLLILILISASLLTTHSYAATSVSSHVIYDHAYDFSGGGVPASSFSQDGSLFGTIALEKDSVSLRIWNTHSFTLFSALKIPNLQNFAISPDNKNLAVIMGARQRRGLSYPYAVWIRDIHSGKTKRVLVKMGTVNAAFYSIIYSHDGKYIAADSGNSLIHVWDAAAGKQIALFRVDGFANAIAFSPDGKKLAALSGEYKAIPRLSVWSIAPKKLLHSVKAGYDLHSVSFSPDGKLLIVNGDKRLTQLFDAHTLKIIRQLPEGHAWDENSHTIFSPDGRYVAFTNDKYLTVRNTQNLEHIFAQFPGFGPDWSDQKLLALHFISSNQLIWASHSFEDTYKITLSHVTF